MHFTRTSLAALALAATLAPWPLAAHAGTIYLCKGYSGGAFWSRAHCATHNALIDRIVSVPDSLPFDQQVNLAQQQGQSAPAPTTIVDTAVNPSPAESRNGECKRLDARVVQLDAMARQPQSGQMQDWIRGERQKARDRQFRIRC